MLPQINLALEAGTTTLLLLLAALLFRDFRTVAAGRLAIAFALGSASHALTATKSRIIALPQGEREITAIAETSN